jgi:hypothetical protein
MQSKVESLHALASCENGVDLLTSKSQIRRFHYRHIHLIAATPPKRLQQQGGSVSEIASLQDTLNRSGDTAV